MTIQVLIVEDDANFASVIAGLMTSQGASAPLVVESRDAAVEALRRDHFDLVILDLKIPSVNGGLDSEPTHGHEVFEAIRLEQPGAAILVLTGSPVERFVQRMLENSTTVDIWGDGAKRPTVQFVKKIDIDTVPVVLASLSDAVARLSDIELDLAGLNLSIEEDRLARIFARRYGGVHCTIRRLNGGLSGVAVYKMIVTDASGARLHDAVVKIGPQDVIDDEEGRYDQSIVRLSGSATPRKLINLSYGGGRMAGIFYSTASGFDANAFSLASGRGIEAERVVETLEAATANWRVGVGQSRKKIREIRRHVLSDEKLAKIREEFDLSWVDQFEDSEIQCRWCVAHGDMHGANVLIDDSGNVVLIDFGDVGPNLASIDPVILELSLLFHIDGPRPEAWPTHAQLRKWGDITNYVVGSPCPEMVRACRAWATRVAAGNREIAVAVYLHTLKQLRYPDTDKDRALALLEGARALYNET